MYGHSDAGSAVSARVVVVLAVVGVTVTLGIATGSVAGLADDAPGEPVTFHGGAADADGTPAPAGVEIIAVVDGDVVDRVTVDEQGVYAGDDPTETKLRTHTEAGDEVMFYVDGADGPQAAETHAIDESGVFEMDLTFPSGTFAPPSDDSPPAPAPQPTPGDGPPVEEMPEDDETPTDDETPVDGTPDDETPAADETPVDGTPDDPPEPDPIEVVEDPDEIREQVNLPEDVEPTRAERSPVTVDEETGQATARFTEESSVESVSFDDDVTGEVTVTELEPDAAADAPGTVVASVDISVPEGTEDTSATVRTRVSAERVAELDVSAESLQVHRHADGEWQALETSVVEETDAYVLLEAQTPGFSLFAVSAISDPVTGPLPGGLSGFSLMLGAVVLVVAALVASLFLRRRREGNSDDAL